MSFEDKLRSVKGIGPATARKILARFPVEEAFVAAVVGQSEDAMEFWTNFPMDTVFGPLEEMSPQEHEVVVDEPVPMMSVRGKTQATMDAVVERAEPPAEEAPAPGEGGRIVNATGQVLKISYRNPRTGKPEVFRLPGRSVAEVGAEVLQSEHLHEFSSRGMIRVLQ